jgi:hypothetical protein
VLHVVSRRWRGWMILPVIGAVFIGGGVAGVEAAGGAINACTQNATGIVRILKSGTTCRSDETAISWSVQGPPGAPGVSGYEVVYGRLTTNAISGPVGQSCASTGKHVLGGGVDAGGAYVTESRPLDDNSGWSANVLNPSGQFITITVWAICATTS